MKDSFFSTTSRSSENTSLKQFDLITLPQLIPFLGQHLFLSCDASRVVRVAYLKCEDTYQPSNDWHAFGTQPCPPHTSFDVHRSRCRKCGLTLRHAKQLAGVESPQSDQPNLVR